jgi:hypothetical protein
VHAQVTWSEDVAEVLYENCTACHNANGIAPFPLIEYSEAQINANSILDAVGTGYMPPWPADTTYQDYAHERVLSAEEIQTIVDWVTSGSAEGDPTLAPPPPVYDNLGFITAPADLELFMEPHVSAATSVYDDYSCFTIPTGLLQDKKIKAFEVIPGNPEIVHHCLVYIDEDGTSQTNTSGFCGGPTEGLIGGYTPGANPTVFPSDGQDFNLGVVLPAGSNLVFAMHYPAGSQGQEDQTRIRLYFYDDATQIREVNTSPIIENWDFTIEANTTEEVTAEFNFVPADVSILSVFPHMHLIGDYIESYAVSPAQDTIPLVRVNHWDFEWQEFYFFKHMQKIPQWSTIYGKAVYNNMPGNPHNPNNPPIDVSAGLNTTDEMFLIYYHFLAYQEGDELIDLEELTQLPTSVAEFGSDEFTGLTVSPNPVETVTTFSYLLKRESTVSLYIYNNAGQLIEKLIDKKDTAAGHNTTDWQPENTLSAGVYYYSMRVDGKATAGKLLLK